MARQQLLLSFIGLAALSSAPALAQDAPAAAAPVRIGIVLPKAQLGQGNTGQDVGARAPAHHELHGRSGARARPAPGADPAQIHAEARRRNCTHVLYTNVEQKKGKAGRRDA